MDESALLLYVWYHMEICSSSLFLLERIVYFVEPSHECLVECLPSCKSEANPPKNVGKRRSYSKLKKGETICRLFLWRLRTSWSQVMDASWSACHPANLKFLYFAILRSTLIPYEKINFDSDNCSVQ